MKALKCRECGREYPLEATHVCEFDFGPLEVVYDYDRIKKSALTKAAIKSRPQTMWRYRELLPVANDPTVGQQVGFTPLVKADRLAKRLGIRELVDQERHRQLPDALLQGPRGQRRVEPRPGVGLRDRRLRLDRQSGQLRGRQRRGRRPGRLRVHSGRSGAGEGRQLAGLQSACHRDQGALRRGQPACARRSRANFPGPS